MNPISTANFASNLEFRKLKAEAFKWACLASTAMGLIMLAVLLIDIAGDGGDRVFPKPRVGPHGGNLTKLTAADAPDIALAHLELVHDVDTGAVTLHVLDANAEEALNCLQNQLALDIATAGGAALATLILQPPEWSPLKPRGDGSLFTGAAEELKGVASFDAVLSGLVITDADADTDGLERATDSVAIAFPQGNVGSEWTLLANADSTQPERAGIQPAVLGSVWVIALTVAFAVPVGVGAAIYLEEYARPNPIKSFIEINIANLAGVPSIVFGILGLTVFVRGVRIGDKGGFHLDLIPSLDQSIIAAALTMALLVLPVIIIAAREALRAVPMSLRQAAFGVGATRWQCISGHVLPGALPGILTGVILAVSRAIGETAPLIMVGAAMVRFTPEKVSNGFMVLPYQIYYWTGLPQEEWHQMAAAAIIVLLGILLLMNALAINIRIRADADSRWLRNFCDLGFLVFALPIVASAALMITSRPADAIAFTAILGLISAGAIAAVPLARNPRTVRTGLIIGGVAVLLSTASVVVYTLTHVATTATVPWLPLIVAAIMIGGLCAILVGAWRRNVLAKSDALAASTMICAVLLFMIGIGEADTLTLIGFVLLLGSVGMAFGGGRSLMRTAKTPK